MIYDLVRWTVLKQVKKLVENMESVDIQHLKFFGMEKCQRIMTVLGILVSVWLCLTCKPDTFTYSAYTYMRMRV